MVRDVFGESKAVLFGGSIVNGAVRSTEIVKGLFQIILCSMRMRIVPQYAFG